MLLYLKNNSTIGIAEDTEFACIVDKVLRETGHDRTSLLCALIVGSYAYPIYKRGNSDLDLVLIIESTDGLAGSYYAEYYGTTIFSDAPLQVEAKIHCVRHYCDELCNGDLVKPYALIRGYKVIVDIKSYAQRFLKLAKKRFLYTRQNLIKELKERKINEELVKAKFFCSENFNLLYDERTQDNLLLRYTRLGEFIKNYFITIMRIRLIKKINNGSSFQRNEVENFLILNNYKGSRMLDHDKYYFPRDLRQFMVRVNETMGEQKTFIELVNVLNSQFEELLEKMSNGPVDLKGFYQKSITNELHTV
jgi:hypothetical protein